MFLSVMGLYDHDNTLFENMAFPDNFTTDQKQLVIESIILETAELELVYPSWDVMHKAIELWSKSLVPTWDRIYKASLLQYNPIENYNSTETETIQDTKSETLSGTDTNTTTGTNTNTTTETNQASGTDTNINSVTAFDSNALAVHDKNELTHGARITNSATDSGQNNNSTSYQYGKRTANSGEIERELHRSGNIGVTTSQQMLLQEIDIADKINVIPLIVKSFIKRFCLMVY